MDQGYNLPKDDRDAMLARALAEGAPVDPGDEGLMQGISTVRDTYRAQAEHDDERSGRIWSGIVQQMPVSPGAPGRTPIRRLPSVPWRYRVAWAVAASLAILFVVMSVLRPNGVQQLAQADAEQVVHTLADGSVITLRAHSTLWRTGANRYRIEGEGFFDVTHNPARTFAVEAGSGIVEVLGTRFDVRTWGEMTAVYLSEGRVKFSGADGGSVVLHPGEMSRLGDDGAPNAPEVISSEQELDWLQGALYFDTGVLAEVVAELEHHFGVQIRIPSELARETLSGRILITSRVQALHDLGLVLGGRFEPSGEKQYEWVAE